MSDGTAETGFSRGLVRHATWFPGRWLWIALAAIVAVDTLWLAASPRLSLDLRSALPIAPVVVLLPLLSAYCGSRTDLHLQRLTTPLTGALFIALSFTAMRVLDHLMMSVPFPWIDGTLAKLDAALGLDWLGYTEWVARQPLVIGAFQVTYAGLTLVALSVFVLLFTVADRGRAQEFVRLIFWSGLATTLIGATVPVRGAMDRFAPAKLQAVFGPDAGIYPIPYLDVLRSNIPHALNLESLPGLVSMPSYHTACALLIAYCCRNVRIVNVLSVIYATVMIASTPIMGGHYFVDLIGGALLVIAVVLIDKRISYSRPILPAAVRALFAELTTEPPDSNEVPDLQSAQRPHPGGAEHRRLEQLEASPRSRR